MTMTNASIVKTVVKTMRVALAMLFLLFCFKCLSAFSFSRLPVNKPTAAMTRKEGSDNDKGKINYHLSYCSNRSETKATPILFLSACKYISHYFRPDSLIARYIARESGNRIIHLWFKDLPKPKSGTPVKLLIICSTQKLALMKSVKKHFSPTKWIEPTIPNQTRKSLKTQYANSCECLIANHARC